MDPFAAEVLNELAGAPEAGEIVLGGYLALKHYIDYRQSHDIDAWWRERRDAQAESLIRRVMGEVAKRHDFELRERAFGDVMSLELFSQGRKLFSFQIAVSSSRIDEPLPSAWPPVLIETLEDNVASKISALVNRGSPRDFQDIRRVVSEGLLSRNRCWELWSRKNLGQTVESGQQKVLIHLASLELRRPLESIEDPAEREQATETRAWFREEFLA